MVSNLDRLDPSLSVIGNEKGLRIAFFRLLPLLSCPPRISLPARPPIQDHGTVHISCELADASQESDRCVRRKYPRTHRYAARMNNILKIYEAVIPWSR